MQTPRRLPWIALFAGLAALLSAGCSTTSSSRSAPTRSPITYAVVLYLVEGEQLDDTGRLNALSLARDTLLAAGIVTPQDQMISDLERAQQLYRARVENGVLTEIAGVPSVSNATTVVLSQPRYNSGRLFWETSYPYGSPYPYESYYASYPVPGPSWGYPGYHRDRRDRKDRDRDRDKGHDRGDRDDHRGDRPDRPNRPDRGDNGQVNAPGPRPNPNVKPEDGRRMPTRPDRGDRVTPSPRPRPSPAPEPPRTRPAPSVPEPKWNRDNRSSSSSSTSSSSDRDKDSKRESPPPRIRKDRLN